MRPTSKHPAGSILGKQHELYLKKVGHRTPKKVGPPSTQTGIRRACYMSPLGGDTQAPPRPCAATTAKCNATGSRARTHVHASATAFNTNHDHQLTLRSRCKDATARCSALQPALPAMGRQPGRQATRPGAAWRGTSPAKKMQGARWGDHGQHYY